MSVHAGAREDRKVLAATLAGAVTRGRDPMGVDLEVSDDDVSSHSWMRASVPHTAATRVR